MIDGLIITSDNLVFEEFNNDFSSEQNHFEYADSLESAYEILDMSMPDYIFVIEKDIKNIKNIIMNLHNHEEY